MELMRSHIVRITVVTLLLCGFGFCFVQPAQTDSNSEDFARWLSSMADVAEIKQELDKLKRTGAEFSRIIKKASQIVTENSRELDSALQTSVDSGQIYQLLLIEWNQFKTENTMARVPAESSLKPLLSFSLDKTGTFLSNILSGVKYSVAVDHVQAINIELPVVPSSVIPMIGGIAIGAP